MTIDFSFKPKPYRTQRGKPSIVRQRAAAKRAETIARLKEEDAKRPTTGRRLVGAEFEKRKKELETLRGKHYVPGKGWH